jgi:outer membrane protein OmpA-like peptidoglycan-associated protein
MQSKAHPLNAETMRQNTRLRIGKIIRMLALSALLIWGCASTAPEVPLPNPTGQGNRLPTTQVVLLPDPDGKVGIVEVSNAAGMQTLDQAWQATETASVGRMPSEPKILEEKWVRQAFHEALEAKPIPPINFILYFKSDSAALSPESLALFTQVTDAIQIRKSTDIIVSGHTDAVASAGYNRTLSLRRAKAVVDILVSRGVDRQDIQITYHGKSNPLVPTPDGVPEPRNRRVEITVR